MVRELCVNAATTMITHTSLENNHNLHSIRQLEILYKNVSFVVSLSILHFSLVAAFYTLINSYVNVLFVWMIWNLNNIRLYVCNRWFCLPSNAGILSHIFHCNAVQLFQCVHVFVSVCIFFAASLSSIRSCKCCYMYVCVCFFYHDSTCVYLLVTLYW